MSNPVESLYFGNYEVLQRPGGGHWLLGEGGYGRTYKAEHRFLRRICALKIIHERHMRNDRQRARFLHEAQTAARLYHPGIAHVYDFGEHEGVFFYAMEFCEGGNLDELSKKRGPMPWREVADFAVQVGDALACAHEAGLLHRDLKPQNVMLASPHGPPLAKLIDFGLVKVMESVDSDSTWAIQSVEGGFKGNYATASPEQTGEDENLDERSDLFSLGVILWWLLIGHNPFEGMSNPRLIADRLSSESYEPRLPADLEDPARRVLARLLEKRPEDRFSKARELVASLAGSGVQPKPAPEPVVELRRPVPPPLPPVAEPAAAPERLSFEDSFEVVSTIEDLQAAKLYQCRDGTGAPFTAMIPDPEASREALECLDRAGGSGARFPCFDYFGRWRAEDDRPVYLFGALGSLRLLEVLKILGSARLVDLAPMLGHLARTIDDCERQFGLGLELNPHTLRVGVAGGAAKPGSWLEIDPRSLRTVPSLPSSGDHSSDVSDASTIVTEESMFPVTSQFAALIYRLVSGTAVKHSAYFSSAAYVPAAALSEDGNQLLEGVISGDHEASGVIDMLRELAPLEGLSIDVFGLNAAGPEGSLAVPVPIIAARLEAERLARDEAGRLAREEAERRVREEAERQVREAAERKVREEAELRAKEEAERRAREDAEREVREEAERRVREAAERKVREEAELRAKAEAERRAKEEAERKLREEAERKVREEAERKAKLEAEKQAKLEAERRVKEEAERKVREESERKEREEAERKAREKAEREAKEAAERRATEDAKRTEQEKAAFKLKEEAERKAREEAERRAREEAERKAREEAERAARKEAERKEKEAARLRAEEEARCKAEERARLKEEKAKAKAASVPLTPLAPLPPAAAGGAAPAKAPAKSKGLWIGGGVAAALVLAVGLVFALKGGPKDGGGDAKGGGGGGSSASGGSSSGNGASGTGGGGPTKEPVVEFTQLAKLQLGPGLKPEDIEIRAKSAQGGEEAVARWQAEGQRAFFDGAVTGEATVTLRDGLVFEDLWAGETSIVNQRKGRPDMLELGEVRQVFGVDVPAVVRDAASGAEPVLREWVSVEQGGKKLERKLVPAKTGSTMRALWLGQLGGNPPGQRKFSAQPAGGVVAEPMPAGVELVLAAPGCREKRFRPGDAIPAPIPLDQTAARVLLVMDGAASGGYPYQSISIGSADDAKLPKESVTLEQLRKGRQASLRSGTWQVEFRGELAGESDRVLATATLVVPPDCPEEAGLQLPAALPGVEVRIEGKRLDYRKLAFKPAGEAGTPPAKVNLVADRARMGWEHLVLADGVATTVVDLVALRQAGGKKHVLLAPAVHSVTAAESLLPPELLPEFQPLDISRGPGKESVPLVVAARFSGVYRSMPERGLKCTDLPADPSEAEKLDFAGDGRPQLPWWHNLRSYPSLSEFVDEWKKTFKTKFPVSTIYLEIGLDASGADPSPFFYSLNFRDGWAAHWGTADVAGARVGADGWFEAVGFNVSHGSWFSTLEGKWQPPGSTGRPKDRMEMMRYSAEAGMFVPWWPMYQDWSDNLPADLGTGEPGGHFDLQLNRSGTGVTVLVRNFRELYVPPETIWKSVRLASGKIDTARQTVEQHGGTETVVVQEACPLTPVKELTQKLWGKHATR